MIKWAGCPRCVLLRETSARSDGIPSESAFVQTVDRMQELGWSFCGSSLPTNPPEFRFQCFRHPSRLPAMHHLGSCEVFAPCPRTQQSSFFLYQTAGNAAFNLGIGKVKKIFFVFWNRVSKRKPTHPGFGQHRSELGTHQAPCCSSLSTGKHCIIRSRSGFRTSGRKFAFQTLCAWVCAGRNGVSQDDQTTCEYPGTRMVSLNCPSIFRLFSTTYGNR